MSFYSSPIVLKSAFLQGLETAEVRSVLSMATQRRFFANSVIFNQGERVRSFYLLTEGRARHFFITPEGQKIVFTLIMPGEIFGSAAITTSMSSRLVSVEALQNSCVLAWDKETIRRLAMRYPKLLDNALSILGGYFDWVLAAYVSLACHSAQLRLAEILMNLANDVGSNNRGMTELAITNEELAHAANVTPFTVSRLMKEWQRSGVLRKTRGKVLLRSTERLLTANL